LWLIVNAGLNSQAYQFRVIAVVSIFTFLTVYFWEKIISIPKILSGGGLFALGGFGVYFVLSNKAELISRTSFEDRISQQKMGISMFLDHPFFGVGIDQMWRYIPMYLQPIDILKNGPDVVPDKTHNIFIDHLAHGGILAGLVFTVFIVFSVIIVFQLMRKTDKKENRPLIALLAGIWAAYVAQQFISTDEVMLMIMPFMAFGLMCKLFLN
jgi:O-antigen ligase